MGRDSLAAVATSAVQSLSQPSASGARDGSEDGLFAAVFFVFFSLQIDAGQIPVVLGVAAVLAVVSALSKMATGWWAARRAGLRVRARARAAATLTPRGEFSIIIASLAISAGVESELGPLAAAYVLITAVAGPTLMRASDPLGEYLLSRQRLRASEARP